MKKIISSTILLLVLQSSMGFAKLECDSMSELVLTCDKLTSPAVFQNYSGEEKSYSFVEDTFFKQNKKFIICQGKTFSEKQGPVLIVGLSEENINMDIAVEQQENRKVLNGDISLGVGNEIISFLVSFIPRKPSSSLNLQNQKYVFFSKYDYNGVTEAVYSCN